MVYEAALTNANDSHDVILKPKVVPDPMDSHAKHTGGAYLGLTQVNKLIRSEFRDTYLHSFIRKTAIGD